MEEQSKLNSMEAVMDSLSRVRSEQDAQAVFDLYVKILEVSISSLDKRKELAKKGLSSLMALYSDVDRLCLIKYFRKIFEPIAQQALLNYIRD